MLKGHSRDIKQLFEYYKRTLIIILKSIGKLKK